MGQIFKYPFILLHWVIMVGLRMGVLNELGGDVDGSAYGRLLYLCLCNCYLGPSVGFCLIWWMGLRDGIKSLRYFGWLKEDEMLMIQFWNVAAV